MAKHNLDSLNPGAFFDLLKNREAAISAANAELNPDGLAVNQLAKTLHPKRQYFLVSSIIEHGANCKSYILKPDKQRGTMGCAYFSAGQYVSVFVRIDG